jgi:tRNA pseudouridine38-40 synthase
MVRNVVGTLVEVGSRERTAEDFGDLLAARDRTRAGATAPPHGLCLVQVAYDSLFTAGRL